ncbi:HEPN domain-containing protein [Patescibacteria group bacterium]|nr:HEPN domain-containing protein [Patescibacteria group bacterium]MBU1472602.1 HEPN domain-containing protein [Patescibacteria group bacterium]MBU2459853.1 HEPN domain-containing protein [Patescibacteria group bacterium]MBU2544086.1 HEPN domain-containing protein [Patescibacteria group bacterium]
MNRKVIAANWLAKAADDLRWCQASISGNVWHGACFSAQQAAEKALKAFLYSQGKQLHKIHDLSALLEQCRTIDTSFETIRERILPLIDYYLQTRYPDMGDFIDYTKEKAQRAHDDARMIVNFVSSRIK